MASHTGRTTHDAALEGVQLTREREGRGGKLNHKNDNCNEIANE
jgi:hypothetical protein